jgi:hypothetical protein
MSSWTFEEMCRLQVCDVGNQFRRPSMQFFFLSCRIISQLRQ